MKAQRLWVLCRSVCVTCWQFEDRQNAGQLRSVHAARRQQHTISDLIQIEHVHCKSAASAAPQKGSQVMIQLGARVSSTQTPKCPKHMWTSLYTDKHIGGTTLLTPLVDF